MIKKALLIGVSVLLIFPLIFGCGVSTTMVLGHCGIPGNEGYILLGLCADAALLSFKSAFGAIPIALDIIGFSILFFGS